MLGRLLTWLDLAVIVLAIMMFCMLSDQLPRGVCVHVKFVLCCPPGISSFWLFPARNNRLLFFSSHWFWSILAKHYLKTSWQLCYRSVNTRTYLVVHLDYMNSLSSNITQPFYMKLNHTFNCPNPFSKPKSIFIPANNSQRNRMTFWKISFLTVFAVWLPNYTVAVSLCLQCILYAKLHYLALKIIFNRWKLNRYWSFHLRLGWNMSKHISQTTSLMVRYLE